MARPAVLVVDDDDAIRTFLTHLLTSRGYAVDSVDSGAQAIARVAGGLAPAVAIVDIMMPGVDGIEVLARLKGIAPTLPVIILSAVGQARTVVEAMKMGASDYLVKPFEEHDVELAVAHHREIRALVGAGEEVCDEAGEVVKLRSRRDGAGRDGVAERRRETVEAAGLVRRDTLLAQAREQVVGGRDALAQRLAPDRSPVGPAQRIGRGRLAGFARRAALFARLTSRRTCTAARRTASRGRARGTPGRRSSRGRARSQPLPCG